MPDSQSPPTLADAPRLLIRLAEITHPEHPAYDDLFAAELALRALLPVLEAALQAMIRIEDDSHGMRVANDGVMQLADQLARIEFDSQAPLEHVRARLQRGVSVAQLAVHNLS